MEEPQPGFVQYRGLTVTELMAHIDYARSKPEAGHLFELHLCPTRIAISLKQKKYKIKPADLQFILRSGSVGREALDSICETLKAKSFDVRIRHSPKLRLITRAVVAIPIDGPGVETRLTELLKILAKESGFDWPTAIAAEHMSSTTASSGLPGEIVHNTEMFELGRKLGRVFGASIRYLAIVMLLAGVVYFYYRS